MNVFVTGSTGYIGSTLISRLNREKGVSKVVALARKTENARELAARMQFPKKLEFVNGDILHHNFDFGNIDAVIHIASKHDPYAIDENTGEAIEVNVGGTERVLQAVGRFRVPYLVVVSAILAYGNQDTLLRREDMTPKPNVMKAVLLYVNEVITKESLANSSTRFAILRLCHTYGAGILPRRIPDELTIKFARLTCAGEDLTIYGDGTQKVDLVHVRDVCDCIYRLLISPKMAWNETYNVGGGSPISINELADVYIKAAAEAGLRAPAKRYLETECYIDLRGTGLGWLDISKVKEKVGWSPLTSIEEGVREMIQVCLGGRELSRAPDS